MSALLVGQVRVRDADKWAVYVAGVAASLAPHPDAEVLFRGAHAATLAGVAPPQATAEQDVVVVIRFPTAATLEAWRAPAASRVG